MDEGSLPHLSRIAKGGSRGVLISTLEPITPCAWASMVTGKNPGKTGVFDFSQVVRGTYDLRFPNRTHVAGPSLWRQAEKHGLKCGIVNVPMGFPAEVLDGIYIAGMGAPSPEDESVFSPKDLRKEVENALGEPYGMMEFAPGRKTKEGYGVLRENLLSYTDFQRRLSLHLLENHELDLFFIVFPSPDQVGHYFWKFHDREHPLHDEREAERFGGVMREVYQEVDKAVGEIMAACVGEKTTTWILSDHGMGPFHRVPDFVGFLEAEGYLRLKVPVAKAEKMIALAPLLGKFSSLKHHLFLALKKVLPLPLKRFLNRLFEKQKEAYKEGMTILSIYDWSQTRVYVTDAKNMGEIHINLKGREPRGIVEAEEYENLREELIKLFEEASLKNGIKAVKKVHRREEIYRGPFLEEAPDLVVEWNLAETGVLDPSEDEIPPKYRSLFRRFDLTPSWSDAILPYNGFHRMEGIWMAKGPGIKVGKKGKEAAISDPYLSILSQLGIPVPEDIDSREMDIWEEGKRPLVKREGTQGKREGRDYTAEEEEAIKARLREMGYLG